MFRTFKFRVHLVATLLLAAFVLSLVAVFLAFGLARSRQMAEELAQATFGGMADTQVQKLEGLIHGAALAVAGNARFPAAIYAGASGGGDDAVLRGALSAAVEANPALYGIYVGLDDRSFYQVIGLAADPAGAAALAAPAAARFAIRRIDGRHPQQAEWRFLGADGAPLGADARPNHYDPTVRPWYAGARHAARLVLTEPYRFESSGALGVTLAQRIAGLDGVVGADLSLATLAEFVARTMAGHPGGSLVLDGADRVLAFAGQVPGGGTPPALLERLAHSRDPVVLRLHEALRRAPGSSITLAGERHVVAVRRVPVAAGTDYRVVSFAPLAAFDEPVRALRNQIVVIAALVLAVSLPLAYAVSRRAARVLGRLAEDSERIKVFDFSGDPRVDSLFYEIDVLGEAHRTMKNSLRERTEALELARDKLESLVRSGLGLAAARDTGALLASILHTGKRISAADAGTLFLATEQGTLRFALRTRADSLPAEEIPLRDPVTGAPNEHYVSVWAALHKQTVVIDDLARETRFDISGTRRFDAATGYRTVSQLNVPMVAVSGEVLGVMQLINAIDPVTGEPGPFDPEIVQFVEALAAQAAMALDNRQLFESQSEMMDALIRILAGAIDAKSAYTGGHCERVPELAMMLAEAACDATDGPLAGFRFDNPDQWREFRIGAWLHDCGKVTTPEYVVDKATKLETLYNRIHEVRTRFEVLLRDAEIARLEAIAAGTDPVAAGAAFEARRAQLAADYAFVAACNVGGESLDDPSRERLARIGGQTWLRHFDDRIGLSHEELVRREAHPPEPLPAVEPLLGDRDHHRIPRTERQHLDDRLGFRVEVPALLYDLGELHNLGVGRGTLTPEERFKINEHIIQTILMLDRLPLPKNLRRVPEYAGTHHETLDGTGYPRGLTAGELSIPARIMAIADIFEALTASDRPYKRGKTLSEAVAMLARFCDQRHIDRDLFRLFLSSGVYRRYGERFLRPEQLDEVELGPYLT